MKFGITQPFACSYLPDREEQLLVYVGDTETYAEHYPLLIQAGFRRSGSQVYRPHCQCCNKCHSIRLPVNAFKPTKSQKRLLNKNAGLRTIESLSKHESYYPLYERYITERHADGTMFPPTEAQFNSFLRCDWRSPVFLEAHDADRLIAVAVTDRIDASSESSGYSAMYTFFDPDYANRSLGTWMILQQIIHAQRQGSQYLYLGYQIDSCKKMNYKNRFYPHERFFNNQWILVKSAEQAEAFEAVL